MKEAETDLTQCLTCDWHIENEKLREFIKWGDRQEIYQIWLKEQQKDE